MSSSVVKDQAIDQLCVWLASVLHLHQLNHVQVKRSIILSSLEGKKMILKVLENREKVKWLDREWLDFFLGHD